MELTSETIVALVVGALVLAAILGRAGGSKEPVALDPEKKIPITLAAKTELSPDTKLFRFSLPRGKDGAELKLGLPVGQHISLSFTDGNGKPVSRSYTPVSSDDDMGVVEFVIKVYYPCERFPEGGKLTQHLDSLEIGDSIDARGPKGKLEYLRHGKFEIKSRKQTTTRVVKKVGCMAGGSGITPVLQVVRDALKDPTDTTEWSIIFANQTEDDILCRDILDGLERDYDNVHVFYTLDRPPSGWEGGEGFITADMIAEHLPAAGPDTLILNCGPPPMIKFACIANLEKLGFTDEMHFEF